MTTNLIKLMGVLAIRLISSSPALAAEYQLQTAESAVGAKSDAHAAVL